MRYTALFAPVLAAVLAFPAHAEQLSLGAISNYFNGITTAEAPFTQVNADGSTSKGTLWISRPHRMRFEYAPPDRTLVLAAAGQVVSSGANVLRAMRIWKRMGTIGSQIAAPTANRWMDGFAQR